jgi:hypothetical protein
VGHLARSHPPALMTEGMLLTVALHEGEEAVIALPIVMLGAAFFLLKWAASGKREEEEEADASAPPTASGAVNTGDLTFIGAGSRSVGEMPVKPPDERQPADDPSGHDGQVELTH